MRIFNVTGLCVPNKHYMVDISDKLARIMEMIDKGDYFTINRARQYGKSTTLLMLTRALPSEYTCISLSFEGVGDTMFASSASFCQRFLLQISKALETADKDFAALWKDETVTDFDLLGYHIEKLCKGRKIVLMIDEVDKTSSNVVFLHFLGMLRSKYLANQAGTACAFHSVILAGVYDIRNIKLKMINEGAYTPAVMENRIYNSPWNIAVNFKVDMSFNPTEIATMLAEYEADHRTGMEIPLIADALYSYTSGYPFLVSRICQCIDEELSKDWTPHSVQAAVNIILRERNTLFDDLYKNLENNKNLYDLIYDTLMLGKKRTYAIGSPAVDIADIYGIIKEADQSIAVSNRIFELVICNHFIAKDEELLKRRITGVLQDDVVDNGRFDMVAGGANKMKMSGNHILITGGTSGIGYSMAQYFYARANAVLICGRREDRLTRAVAKMPGIQTFKCDVGDPTERAALLAYVQNAFSDVNILINNAGIQRDIDLTKGMADFERGESELRVNLEAPILLSAMFTPLLAGKENAAIVNVSSGLAFMPDYAVGAPIYYTTKAGLHAFSVVQRKQLASSGIKVIEIIPPAVESELNPEGRKKRGAIRSVYLMPTAEFVEKALIKMEQGEDEIRLERR